MAKPFPLINKNGDHGTQAGPQRGRHHITPAHLVQASGNDSTRICVRFPVDRRRRASKKCEQTGESARRKNLDRTRLGCDTGALNMYERGCRARRMLPPQLRRRRCWHRSARGASVGGPGNRRAPTGFRSILASLGHAAERYRSLARMTTAAIKWGTSCEHGDMKGGVTLVI